jgi:hypothetical protein
MKAVQNLIPQAESFFFTQRGTHALLRFYIEFAA